jgi:hypothetical protein
VKAFKPAQLSTPILVVLHFQPSAHSFFVSLL